MKSVNIEIIDVAEKEGTGKTGKPYSYIEVTFREWYNGKPATKGYKALEFNTPPEVYQTLLNAKREDKYNVIQEKNAGGYWQWVEIHTQQGDIKGEPVSGSKAEQYKEQDDRRQTLIVRQSSLAQAVQVSLARGNLETDEILATAKVFEEHINR